MEKYKKTIQQKEKSLNYQTIDDAEKDIKIIMQNNRELQLEVVNLEKEISNLKEKQEFMSFREIVLWYELLKDIDDNGEDDNGEEIEQLLINAILLLNYYEEKENKL